MNVKQIFYNHDWCATDSQGHYMECSKCGIEWTIWECWGEPYIFPDELFSIKERIIGFIKYRIILL